MRMQTRARGPNSDVEKVYNMLRPKPKPLLMGQRQLVRHGELGYFSPNTVSKKMRYFFLFSDCLLLSKRMGQAKFQLKIYMHLRGAIKLVTMNGSPTYEFRLLIPEKGTLKKRKERRIILFGKSEDHKQAWIRDIQRCLWESNGRKGPDPTKIPIKDTTYDEEEWQDEPDDSPRERTKNRSGTSDKKKKEIEGIEDIDYSDDGSSSSSDDEGAGEKKRGDPLIVFDPFGGDGSHAGAAGGASSGQFPGAEGYNAQHQGYDTRGQAIPRGVMLPPLSGGEQGQYSQGGSGLGAPGSGTYGSGGMPSYGQMGYSGPGLVTASPAVAYSQGAYYGQGGVSAGGAPGGYDPSALYGAAGQVASGVGGLFGSEALERGGGVNGGSQPGSDGSGGIGVGGSGGIGVGAGGVSGGVGVGAGGDGGSALDDLAYKELQEATRAIEAIAQELAARPRKVQGADASPTATITLDHVCDAILDGTQALAKAASVLLRATAAAQKERVERDVADHRSKGAIYHSDPVWANGLISAGRYAVATTQLLVDTANKVIKGEAQEEQLTACAQSVGVATTQLVFAERAKGNINSPTHLQLEEAAVGIKRATAALVEAAKMHATQKASPLPEVKKERGLTGNKIAQLEAQARVLALEEQTRKAREELLKLRKDDYDKNS